MRSIINKLLSGYLKFRMDSIRQFMASPKDTQLRFLLENIRENAQTVWGKAHGFSAIQTHEDFARQVPVGSYETHRPYIQRMMEGESDVLYRGFVQWFAKSSGTTGAVSKYLPVSTESFHQSHIKGGWDTLAFLYDNNPECNVFAHRALVMGGTFYPDEGFPNVTICDISALLLQQMPFIGRQFYVPDPAISTLRNWEEKILLMAEILPDEDISMIGGVPTWTNIFLQNVLRATGKKDVFEIWPNLQTYIHGGVSFEPHRQQFDRYFASKKVFYQEIYNASEGYFAVQNDLNDDGMLLLLDNGTYFEFVPKSEWGKDNPEAVPIWEVELGENYALVITTNSGLWRYLIGDTVQFTSLDPYKIKISGRTSLYVNAFGEDVILSNTDKAVTKTCLEFNAIVADYTMAPIYFDLDKKGGHEWVVEFEKAPECVEDFAEQLDLNLQKINSNYEQKRFNSIALDRLRLHTVPKGTFSHWLKAKGKYGGQHKVPRLSNERRYVEEILSFSAGVG